MLPASARIVSDVKRLVSLLSSPKHSLVLLRGDDIVNFKDHFNDLSCELELLLFGHDGLEDTLFAHVGRALMVSIDADEWILSSDLFFAKLADIFDRVVTRVLG